MDYKKQSPGQFASSTAVDAIIPTLSDTVDDPSGMARAILVIVGPSNVAFITINGTLVTLTAVPAWTRIDIGVRRVNATNTTAAANLLLLY